MALTEQKIKNARAQERRYRLNDDYGLALIVQTTGNKIWHYRYRFDGKEKVMVLGDYPFISLVEARLLRDQHKKALLNGIDPKAQLEAEKVKAENTFSMVALKWCDSKIKWSEPYRVRVKEFLKLHAFNALGGRLVADLTLQDLIVPIKKVAAENKNEAATRLSQRIKAIMLYSVQQGFITYNPAQDLTGVVSKNKTTHRPALEIEQLPKLLQRIQRYEAVNRMTKLALQFSLLTFVRSSELRFAKWNEIDFEQRIWTIPAEREEVVGIKHSHRGAKMKSPHLVPLSDSAILMLQKIKAITGKGEWIFALNPKNNKPMSENTLNKALRNMGYDTKTEVCLHGFRAIACSTLVESGFWSNDVIERQMSHQERNSVRAAYIHKAQHLNERKKMMQWWADYLKAIQTAFIPPYDFKPVDYQRAHQISASDSIAASI